MGDYYDKAGRPISNVEWISLFSVDEYAIIQQNHFKNFFLSTVWDGISTYYTRQGRPVIFETMIFYKGRPGRRWRYSTEQAASRHHKTLLRVMQETILKKQLSKKWTRREQHKLLSKLYRI